MNRRSFFGRALAALAVVPGLGWVGSRSVATTEEVTRGLLQHLPVPSGWAVVGSSVTSTRTGKFMAFERCYRLDDSQPPMTAVKANWLRGKSMQPFFTANGRHGIEHLDIRIGKSHVRVSGFLRSNLAS